MQCASGHENPVGQAFCGTCGVPLSHDAHPVGSQPVDPPMASPPAADSNVSEGVPRVFPAGPPTSAPPGSPEGSDFLPGGYRYTATSEVPSGGSAPNSRRLVAVLAAGVAVLAVGVYLLTRSTDSHDDRYLQALTAAKVRSSFPTDSAAILKAKSVCEEFDRTGDPRGGQAEKIGVQFYCPKWSKDFKILETATITGTFAIYDSDYYLDDGDPCEGEGGYGDLNSSTQVVLKNGDGDQLARTDLDSGEYRDYTCEFTYEFKVTEGEDTYLLSVGDRGESSYEWTELKDGPALTIGL